MVSCARCTIYFCVGTVDCRSSIFKDTQVRESGRTRKQNVWLASQAPRYLCLLFACGGFPYTPVILRITLTSVAVHPQANVTKVVLDNFDSHRQEKISIGHQVFWK